jgi:hypothetical protein
MNEPRIARSFFVSLAVIGSVLAVPLVRCTSTTAPKAAATPRRQSLSGPPSCGVNDPFGPVICIGPDGNPAPDQKTVSAHSQNGPHAVPIVVMGPAGSVLQVNTRTCPQVHFSPSCTDDHGDVCAGVTVIGTSGPCTYFATVDGVTGTDPIVDTDTCCP